MNKAQLIAELTKNGIAANANMTLPELKALYEKNIGPLETGGAATGQMLTKEFFIPTIPEVKAFKGTVGGLAPFQEPVSGPVEVVDIVESSSKKNIIVVFNANGKTGKITLADLVDASDRNPNAQVVQNLTAPGQKVEQGHEYSVAKNFVLNRTKQGENVTNTVSAAE